MRRKSPTISLPFLHPCILFSRRRPCWPLPAVPTKRSFPRKGLPCARGLSSEWRSASTSGPKPKGGPSLLRRLRGCSGKDRPYFGRQFSTSPPPPPHHRDGGGGLCLARARASSFLAAVSGKKNKEKQTKRAKITQESAHALMPGVFFRLSYAARGGRPLADP